MFSPNSCLLDVRSGRRYVQEQTREILCGIFARSIPLDAHMNIPRWINHHLNMGEPSSLVEQASLSIKRLTIELATNKAQLQLEEALRGVFSVFLFHDVRGRLREICGMPSLGGRLVRFFADISTGVAAEWVLLEKISKMLRSGSPAPGEDKGANQRNRDEDKEDRYDVEQGR